MSTRKRAASLMGLVALLVGTVLLSLPNIASAGVLNDIDLEGIEGLNENLPIDATSFLPSGGTATGIVTIDPIRGTTAIVEPSVSTSASGIVSGLAQIRIYEGEVLVGTQVIPVSGRTRVNTQIRVRVYEGAGAASVTKAGSEQEDEYIRQLMLMSIRGAYRHPSTHLPYVFVLSAVANWVMHNGSIIRGEPIFNGRAVVRFGADHIARTLLQISLINYAYVNFLVAQNLLYQNIHRGAFYGEAGADSDSLGFLAGGLFFARLAYYNAAQGRIGRFLVRGNVDRMRFVQGGLLFLTLAEALSPTFTFADFSEEALPLKQLVATPAAFSVYVLSVDPRLFD